MKLSRPSGLPRIMRRLRGNAPGDEVFASTTDAHVLDDESGEPSGRLRHLVTKLVDATAFRVGAMVIIVLNAMALGLETSPTVMAIAGPQLHAFDQFVIVVFCIEIGLRLVARGFQFFRDPWDVFDFAVVAITLAPANDSLSVLRALRVLRVLRLVSAIPRLRRVVGALLHAVPGVAAIGVLLLLIFYVYAVITTNLFGSEFPIWFGTVGDSMFSLFQIMTLESWSMGIVRPILDVHAWAWIVFVSFIVVSSFTVLNLFIAIVIDSMQTMHANPAGQASPQGTDEAGAVLRELKEMRQELAELRASQRP